MKKILLTSAILISVLAVHAQCIINTSLTAPGIFPPAGSYLDSDSNIVLPIINPGVAYSEVIQVVVPSDTLIDTLGSQFPAIVDSFKITNVSGLPTGFSYECNPMSCVWPGGTNGCVTIYGTTSAGYIYPLTVSLTGYVRLFNLPLSGDDEITNFRLVVGYLGEEETGFKELIAYPNPANDYINISFEHAQMENIQVSVLDLAGRVVMSEVVATVIGVNELTVDINQLSSGFYTYRIEGARTEMSGRFVKQ